MQAAAGKAGAVWWNPVMGFMLVQGITVDAGWRVSDGVKARVLLQELGHCLGLEHSDQPAVLVVGMGEKSAQDRVVVGHHK